METDLESVLEKGSVHVQHFVTEENDETNFKPVKYVKYCQEVRKERNNEEDICWGCIHSFGADQADPTTQRLFSIYKENLKCCPIDEDESALYQVIQNAHIRLVVESDPENQKIWSIQSIKEHLNYHMIHKDHQLYRDIRHYCHVEESLLDNMFSFNDLNGEKKVDPSKVNLFLRVNKNKHSLLERS